MVVLGLGLTTWATITPKALCYFSITVFFSQIMNKLMSMLSALIAPQAVFYICVDLNMCSLTPNQAKCRNSIIGTIENICFLLVWDDLNKV